MSKGHVFDADKMFLRLDFGEAHSRSRETSYELSVNPADGSPIIRSRKTGRWFVLGWPDILDMAVEAGIDRDPSLN